MKKRTPPNGGVFGLPIFTTGNNASKKEKGVTTMKVQEAKDLELLKIKITEFPVFIVGFFNYKMPLLSPSSLLEYTRDFCNFFNWLLIHKGSYNDEIKDVSLDMLNELNVQDVHDYINYLVIEKNMARATFTRKINSIRSLFTYLYEIAEDDNQKPLLTRNVLKKIIVKRPATSFEIAERMEQKLLLNSEISDFISYLRDEYCLDTKNNLQALYSYEINKERDICILYLVLSSGLRVSDLVNLNMNDVVLAKNLVFVQRPTLGRAPVLFDEQVKSDLMLYLSIRNERYNPADHEQAIFLTVPNGKKQGQRMTKRAIQEMVIKYAKKFGKDNLTVSKLRDSFGVKHVSESSIIYTKHQLLFGSIESAEKFLYINQEKNHTGK